MKARIKRCNFTDKQVTGLWEIIKNDNLIYKCYTLEPPWLNNKNKISCIPEGVYIVRKRHSPKHGWHFHITGVIDRELILIHSGNFYTQTEGCILPGSKLTDINNDNLRDVISSQKTLSELNNILPNEFELEIIS